MKLKFTLLLLLSAFTLAAQVKIGDNPNTINSNSLLEMESTNKGFLPPRVALNNASTVTPLSGTVTPGMLVYSTGGSLPDGYYYWTGTQWTRLTSSSNDRANYVLVKSTSDLPAPVSGVITLLPSTLYEINGTISLGSKINLNGSWITGKDAVNDKLVYTGSSGELFTGSGGGNIRNLTLTAATAGAKVFNLDAASAARNLVIMNCYVLGCDNIGTIKGYGGTVYLQTIALFYNNNGFTFENNTNLVLNNLLWDASNKNTFEKYVGTFSIIQKFGGDFVTLSANSAVCVDVSGITSIGAGSLKMVLFTGTGTYVNGTFSKQWQVDAHGIRTESDEVSSGNLYITSPVTTTFSAANTATKILGTTTATGLFRVSASGDNRLVYAGTKTRRFRAICSLSMIAAGSNKNFSFYIVKNGTLLPESRQYLKLGSNGDRGSVTLSCTLEMAPNDYVEVWVENNTDASSLDVETMNLAIQ